VAANPLVEELTIIEINPGYLQLVGAFPEVSGLLRNPKVHIEIGDGRRWLERRPDASFDLVVANTVFHWRANAARLLSTEFLQLVRRHLAPGGVYYYNTTGSDRALLTGLKSFAHAWRIQSMLALSDEMFAVDLDTFRRQLVEHRLDRPLVDELVAEVESDLESRDRAIARMPPMPLITDDNMGNEWDLPQRYRRF